MNLYKQKLNFNKIEGYDPKNYDHKQGIDATGNDIISNRVIEQAADMVLAGYADSTIRDKLYDLYTVNSWQAKFIINKAHRFIQTYEEEQEKNMLQKQNSRLFSLYRKAVADNDNKTALAVLAELNKVNKLYVTKVELSSDVFTLDLGIQTTKDSNEDSE